MDAVINPLLDVQAHAHVPPASNAQLGQNVAPPAESWSRSATLQISVLMRDMQIAMRHADPRTTGLYDMAKNNNEWRASHRVASFLAGMTGKDADTAWRVCGARHRASGRHRARARRDGRAGSARRDPAAPVEGGRPS